MHHDVEKQAGVGNVWSLETLRRWLREKAGITDVATLKQYVDILPEHLTRRFISAEEDAVVVSGRIPDIDASQLLPVIDQLDERSTPCARRIPATRSRSPAFRRSPRATAPT